MNIVKAKKKKAVEMEEQREGFGEGLKGKERKGKGRNCRE